MRLPVSLMGCLPSRSTIVPVPGKNRESENSTVNDALLNKLGQPSKSNGALSTSGQPDVAVNTSNIQAEETSTMSLTRKTRVKPKSMDSDSGRNRQFADEEDEDDMISMLNDEHIERSSTLQGQHKMNSNMNESNSTTTTTTMRDDKVDGRVRGSGSLRQMGDSLNTDETSDTNRHSKEGESSVQDEKTNMDLLRQYIMVDYEIGILEDKDALRVYHEKIEQLEQFEQFERELDMISSEAEEVATRKDSKALLDDLLTKDDNLMTAIDGVKDVKEPPASQSRETESISMLSAILPLKSWLGGSHKKLTPTKTFQNIEKTTSSAIKKKRVIKEINDRKQTGTLVNGLKREGTREKGERTGQYSSVEEVFNRKIVLEKQRDRLKKEVEMAIIECDKLQQRYKKRDEILDKLFEGRTGNGLENHLEQQLNWLLEQKHYVDQVYYVWKRAETLTNQTCEHFATALELIKKLPEVEDSVERSELVKNIGDLMIKSRQGMEHAQKYNPNVDAPFFTDNETERFDKIIDKISTNSLNQSEFSQILTVVQFAYKRAVSIRLWLEQILQTTIARDSFELAEEYKWIAIQLRKERINLIKAKLDSPSNRQMVQELREQISRQFLDGDISKRIHEVNRDCGVGTETKDTDLDEEVYRLLEMNRFRFINNAPKPSDDSALTSKPLAGFNLTSGDSALNRQSGDRYMSGLIEDSQLKSEENLIKVNSFAMRSEPPLGHDETRQRVHPGLGDTINGSLYSRTTASGYGYFSPEAPVHESNPKARLIAETPIFDTSAGRLLETPTRLRIELDEKAKQSLLQQVDQIHSNHKKRIERLRGSNKAIATSTLMNRLQGARSAASHHTKEMVNNSTSGSI